MKLIASMVGRNEESRYLKEVLDHLEPMVDMVVFTDDASTDNTAQIARDAGAKVYSNPEPLFTINEGQFRNGAWQNISNHAEEGDWILAIDCDEKLYVTGPQTLEELMANERYSVLGITFYHMWNRTQYRVDKLWAPTVSTRLFRFIPGGSIQRRELACGAEPTYVRNMVQCRQFLPNTGLKMQHLGYIDDEDKVIKYKRYMELDNGRFHNISHLESIIDPDPTLIDWKV